MNDVTKEILDIIKEIRNIQTVIETYRQNIQHLETDIQVCTESIINILNSNFKERPC